MRRRLIAYCAGAVVLANPMLVAQTGRSGDWMTSGNDAQRSSWVRSDLKISPASMQKPGFQLLWKMKFDAGAPTQPVLMDRIIGYKGFRTLAFVGTSADKVFTVDTDLARMEWQQQLPVGPKPAKADCPGGITSALARPTTANFPVALMAGGFGGRGTPAKSAVGEPDQGAVTLARVAARPPLAFPAPPKDALPVRRPRPNAPQMADGPFGRGITPVYAVSSDGSLHILNVQDGAMVGESYKFLPPGANAVGLLVVRGVAYAATDGNCGGASGVWSVDTNSQDVNSWTAKSPVAGSAGAAMGPDGTVYVATRGGELAALETVTLKEKGVYKAAGAEFTSSPVLFQFKNRTLLAAASRDGRIHLLDAAGLEAAAEAPVKVNATALAAWQDQTGTPWLLAPGGSSVTAWKVLERGGKLVIENGWTSRELKSPLAPVIVNGVVFTGSAGAKGAPAVVYALDGATGKELWNSGKAIASFANSAGLSSGGGQVYLGTNDGTLYTFGFPMEH